MSINFNTEPYYDDFSQEKQFYKIMFKPGYAVQTRELNQLQSILQAQIKTHGQHMFKEGAMVIPGATSVDTNANYVKLQPNSLTTSFIGKVLTGQTTGVKALVIYSVDVEGPDPLTLYVKYTQSGTDNQSKVFADNEVLVDENNIAVATTALIDSVGMGSISTIQPGFFFIKNHFVYVPEQTVALEKYSNTPTYKIGLDVIESFVSSDDDYTLLDNAQGSYNYAAPGADRYGIDLVYTKKNLNVANAGQFIIGSSYTITESGNTDFVSIGAPDNFQGTRFTATGVGSGTGKASINEENFIQLIVVINGSVQQKFDSTEYNIIEQTMARRTFDESGDYTVKNFPIDVREYRNNYRGDWIAYTNYLAGDIILSAGNYYVCRKDGTSSAVAPTQSVGTSSLASTGVSWTYTANPFFNRGIYNAEPGETLVEQNINKDKLAIGIEPGKAYVRGYEIEKVGTSYIAVSKARDYQQQNNVKIPATVGNYSLITNLNSLPNVSSLPLVKLFNQLTTTRGVSSGIEVGTARIRFIEFNNDTTPGTQTTKYKLGLFDVKMNDGYTFSRDVKQFYILGGNAQTTFTADVFPINRQLSGSITASNVETALGQGTLFSSELKTGDYISVNGNIRKVVSIISNSEILLDAPLDASGAIIFRVETTILEQQNEALIFGAPFPFVRKIGDEDDNVNTSYTVATRFTQSSDLGGVITLTVNAPDSFASVVETDNYLVLDVDTGQVVVPGNIQYGPNTQKVLITTPSAEVRNYIIIAAVNKAGTATEKTKTLTTQTVEFTTRNAASASVVRLGKTDGFRLLEVKMDTGTFIAPTGIYSTDITDRYVFNDGQKSTHYDLASISLRSGQPLPSAPIRVVFEYFAHSTTGDHFTVNSYLQTINYDEIPAFGGIPLSYVFDFRPSINDAGTGFTSVSVLKRGVDIESDFSYYLARKDKICINQNGNIFSITGTPANIPSEPGDISTGMTLYKIEYQPYTYNTNSMQIETIDNKRYTMRDIGKLEKRIDNLEYYTSLSLLEQQTQSLEIQDEFGLNRFKNGFIVDNFTGHGIGDVFSPDYKCSIDMENSELRPSFYMDNVNLIEANVTDAQRKLKGYQVTGDLITLPYTEVEMVSQLDASTVENVNPFAIFTFLGSIDLNPPSDDWFETNRLPDIITNVEGNFNSIYAAEEASGALSGIWNAWQTQWTGATLKANVSLANARGVQSGTVNLGGLSTNYSVDIGGLSGGGIRRTTIEVSATQIGQSRTGVRSIVVPRIDTQQTADRTLSVAVIPYIRARSLLFVVKGLKPNTLFYPFFDSIRVDTFTTPSSQLVIPRNTSFSSTVRAGGESDEPARLVNNNAESALDRGDVVFVKQRGSSIFTKENSPGTAVLSLVSNKLNDTNTVLHIVNLRGSFQTGDIIAGSITGATATISEAPILKAKGGSLISNSTGEVVGVFDIPNTESNRFRTGSREFKLSDEFNDTNDRTSVARKQYRAEGVIETKQASYTSTRNADVRQETINDFQLVTQTSSRVVSDTGWYDPLAQTFLVQSPGGAFITSVDIFFATKDDNIPIRMQIREVVNGYPGKVILPFSEAMLTPDKVNISDVMVDTSDGQTLPAPTPTRFTFDSPVYLNNFTEYCLALVSDSNNYKVWITDMGQQSVVTNRIISDQPYAGVLFKSQNASTWTANQNQDMMFRINKAKFVTNTFGEIDFTNNSIPSLDLRNNPFYTVAGSNYIRVTHENNGLFAGAMVTISGADSVAGIPNSEINKSHVVVSSELDSYVIQTVSNAGFTGNFGGSLVRSSENIQYNVIQPIVQQQVFPDTNMFHSISTHSGRSVDGTESPYIKSGFYAIEINENNPLTEVQMIANRSTEIDMMNGEKSITLRAQMITSNENVSPVIDIARLSAIAIQNRINQPSESDTNVPALDSRVIVSANSSVSITENNKFVTSDLTTRLAFATVLPGRYITTTGFATPSNNNKFLVLDVANDGSYIQVDAVLTNAASGSAINLNVLDRYVSEIAPVGSSSVAKYVSKKINIKNPSSFLKIRFAADVAADANIDVYYKTQPVGSSLNFDETLYTLASPTQSVVKSDDGVFTDVEYSLQDLVPFNAVQVKLVMNSTSSAKVVRVRDLQIIGCA
jgi:hypothetical protein